MDNHPDREPLGSAEPPDVCADSVTVLHALGKLVATKRVTYNKPTQTYQIREYDNLKTFRITEHPVDGIDSLAALLDRIARNPQACVVRGKPAPGINRQRALRRLHPKLNPATGEVEPATLEPADRRWLLLDIDGIDCPPGIDPLHEPASAVEHVVSVLPRELAGVTCRWAFTSGHWIKRQDAIRLRLAFWLDRPVSAEYLEAWLAGFPVDTAVFRPAQIQYIAHPIFEGVADPVPLRSGIWRGDSDVAELPEIYLTKLTKPARTYAVTPGAPGLGYEGHVAGIGDHVGGKGFNAPILSAVGAYFRRHGAGADAEWLISDLETVIRERGITRSAEYVERRIRDLRGVVEHTRAREAAREAAEAPRVPFVPAPEVELFERVAPSFALPTATIDQASADLREAMDKVISSHVPEFLAERRQHLIDAAIAAAHSREPGPAPMPPQFGIAADMASGKTQTAIVLTLAAITRHPDLRILYAVPNHVTGEDFVERINLAAGQEIARRWSGLDRPDPEHEGKLMCWRAEEMRAVTEAGGTTSTLCGSSARGFCPYHDRGEENGICGVRRQALAAADPNIRVWVIPHAMLDKALPTALKRPKLMVEDDGEEIEVALDAFDLVIIDEAPWPGMFGGVGPHPYSMPLDALMRDLSGDWAVPAREGESPTFATSRVSFLMSTAHSLLSDNPDGWMVRAALRPGRAELSADMCKEARRLTFRLLKDVDAAVDPEEIGTAPEALKEIAAHNREVFKLTRLWSLLALVADLPDDTDRSPYIRITNKAGRRNIVMAWKQHVHESLLAVPVLYLDGTMNAPIASLWLERLDVVAEIKAKTPECVHRRQVADRAIGHTMIAPDPKTGAKIQTTARNNVAKLARLMELRAAEFAGQGKPNDRKEVIDVAAIVPMATRLAIETGFGSGEPLVEIPLLHWQNQRGSNRFRAVRCLQIIGRPLPAPAVPEMLAWLSSGKVGESIPAGEFYPERDAGLLMRDGTGRKVLQRFHPNPLAEAWRWQLCEGEVLQGEARGRAKRRTAESPLLVEIITNVPLPLEIDEVVTAESLLEAAHPLAMMQARGAVFEDFAGIGAACGDMFRDGADATNAAKQWFKNHPEREAERQAFLASQTGYQRYRYRPAGRRKSGHVLVSADAADPRTVVEKLAGDLDVWVPACAGSSVEEAATVAEEAHAAPPAPAEHEPAAYEPEEVHAIAPELATWISLDTREGMEAFKLALTAAGAAGARKAAQARRSGLSVWEDEDRMEVEGLDLRPRPGGARTWSVIKWPDRIEPNKMESTP